MHTCCLRKYLKLLEYVGLVFILLEEMSKSIKITKYLIVIWQKICSVSDWRLPKIVTSLAFVQHVGQYLT